MADTLLAVEGLTKRFGGILASDNIVLDAKQGELHAIIGPNGAGKTTLIGQLTGMLTPDTGTVRFAGQDITALPAYLRSLLGLARCAEPDEFGIEGHIEVALTSLTRCKRERPAFNGAPFSAELQRQRRWRHRGGSR